MTEKEEEELQKKTEDSFTPIVVTFLIYLIAIFVWLLIQVSNIS